MSLGKSDQYGMAQSSRRSHFCVIHTFQHQVYYSIPSPNMSFTRAKHRMAVS